MTNICSCLGTGTLNIVHESGKAPCLFVGKQTNFYPRKPEVDLQKYSVTRELIGKERIDDGRYLKRSSATIISYSKPWFILENAHMLFFY